MAFTCMFIIKIQIIIQFIITIRFVIMFEFVGSTLRFPADNHRVLPAQKQHKTKEDKTRSQPFCFVVDCFSVCNFVLTSFVVLFVLQVPRAWRERTPHTAPSRRASRPPGSPGPPRRTAALARCGRTPCSA